MKRLFVCLMTKFDELQSTSQIENQNSKAKIIICDETTRDKSTTLESLIREKLELTSLNIKKICLRNGVTIDTCNQLKDDDFVYVIVDGGDNKQEINEMLSLEPRTELIKDEWITLNVGGKLFNTTRTTLVREPDSFFGRMFSLEFQDWTHRKQSGAIAIDRSSRYFEVILDYLR
jgi:hypothetical protein